MSGAPPIVSTERPTIVRSVDRCSRPEHARLRCRRPRRQRRDKADRRTRRLEDAHHSPSPFVAFCVALGVGLFFGYSPARRAARLDPIDALGYE
jgi:hypothetical protein